MTALVKASYKITNWRTYNDSLVQWGDMTFWIDEDVIDAWEHDNDEPKVGRPSTYSDLAVECVLALRDLIRLPYRQTEGFGRSLVKMQVEVAIPDYSSLAKRAAKLSVSLSVSDQPKVGAVAAVAESGGGALATAEADSLRRLVGPLFISFLDAWNTQFSV